MTGTRAAPTSTAANGAFAAFSRPSFTAVWLSGLVWHLCRWGAAFLGTWLANDMTGSPRLVQLAGTVLYAPLLLGGVAGGVISDRWDRLNTVRVQLAVLVPLTIAMGWLVRNDRLALWMLYLYLFVIGIGWVTDMTSRRALVFDIVGEQHLDAGMAMESLSLSSGMVLGSLVGGYAIDAVGVGAAWWWIAGFLALALGLLATTRRPAVAPAATTGGTARAKPIQDLLEGLAMLGTNKGLVSVLGITVIANFFLFAYFPLVPVIGEELDVSASLVGLLLAGTGIGMMTGSLVFARLQPTRRGLAYIGGVAFALVFLALFALGPTYGLTLAAIICSGLGSGFFGSTQSTLVIAAVPDDARGRALGLLSMGIGALPVGMYVLGEIAEAIGARPAVLLNAGLGMVALAVWMVVRPEVRSMTSDG